MFKIYISSFKIVEITYEWISCWLRPWCHVSLLRIYVFATFGSSVHNPGRLCKHHERVHETRVAKTILNLNDSPLGEAVIYNFHKWRWKQTHCFLGTYIALLLCTFRICANILLTKACAVQTVQFQWIYSVYQTRYAQLTPWACSLNQSTAHCNCQRIGW